MDAPRGQERTLSIHTLPEVTNDVDQAAAPCPLTAALEVLGGKWKLIILYWLAQGVHRFSDLQRRQPAITHKVLTDSLRQLEDHGLVARTIYPEVPPKVEYRLTDYGQTVLPLVDKCEPGATSTSSATPSSNPSARPWHPGGARGGAHRICALKAGPPPTLVRCPASAQQHEQTRNAIVGGLPGLMHFRSPTALRQRRAAGPALALLSVAVG